MIIVRAGISDATVFITKREQRILQSHLKVIFTWEITSFTSSSGKLVIRSEVVEGLKILTKNGSHILTTSLQNPEIAPWKCILKGMSDDCALDFTKTYY